MTSEIPFYDCFLPCPNDRPRIGGRLCLLGILVILKQVSAWAGLPRIETRAACLGENLGIEEGTPCRTRSCDRLLWSNWLQLSVNSGENLIPTWPHIDKWQYKRCGANAP
jgi:hypothetical protein